MLAHKEERESLAKQLRAVQEANVRLKSFSRPRTCHLTPIPALSTLRLATASNLATSGACLDVAPGALQGLKSSVDRIR